MQSNVDALPNKKSLEMQPTEVSLSHKRRPMNHPENTKRHASGTQEVQGDSCNADRERKQWN
jgi:hypothetical protein